MPQASSFLTPAMKFESRYSRARRFLFIIGIFFFFLLYKLNAPSWRSHIPGGMHGALKESSHPVELLIQKSSAEFSAMLSRQSSTLEAAIMEYQKRYRRKPPPGFDKWFQYAKAVESPIIDDFNSIMEDLEPFWKVSPAQLRKNVQQALSVQDPLLWSFRVEDGRFHFNYDEWMSTQVSVLLADALPNLPDVLMAGNAIDEPRVIFLKEPSSGDTTSNVQFHDAGRRPSWAAATGPCAQQASELVQSSGDPLFLHGLPFVHDVKDSKNLCLHPEYKNLHGILISPVNLIYTNDSVPIFSPAKLSTFSDILLPSPHYIAAKLDYSHENDRAWEDKKNLLYWAGSTTGSYKHGNNQNWHLSHRERFVTAANNLQNITNTFLFEARPNVWKTHQSEFLSQLCDVKFTAMAECDEDECQTEADYFHVQPHEDSNAGFQYRFVFDLDGNSFSGRFYTLLRSHSVVLKQTIFREWHDERLFPWVHYVPISLSLDELPEVLRYLALTENGSRRAKEIADNGREWAFHALREEDAQIYLYRLVLEYARLLDDDRDTAYGM